MTSRTARFQNLGEAAMEWGESAEVEDLKELDEEFKASPEGKALMEEWREFGEALKGAIEETENGIHIHNDHMDELEDRIDDIKEDYDDLEDTHWNEDFHNAFKAAFTNEEFEDLHEAGKEWKESEEHQELEHSLHDFFETLDENVEVSDIPEEWKDEMDEFEE